MTNTEKNACNLLAQYAHASGCARNDTAAACIQRLLHVHTTGQLTGIPCSYLLPFKPVVKNSPSCLSASFPVPRLLCDSLQEVVQISWCSIQIVKFAEGWTYRNIAHVSLDCNDHLLPLKGCVSI